MIPVTAGKKTAKTAQKPASGAEDCQSRETSPPP